MPIPPAPGQTPPQPRPATTPFGLAWPQDQWENWWALNAERHLDLTRSFAARSRLAEATGDAFVGSRGGPFDAAPVDTARVRILQRSRPLLLQLLKDSNATVRGEAALALGKLGGSAEVPELVNMLADGNRFVRSMAALGLGLTGAREALPHLGRIARDENEKSQERAAALMGLGVLHLDGALQVLLTVAAREGEERMLQACAWFALGLTGSEDAARLLEAEATNPRTAAELRAVATGALGEALGCMATDRLLILLADPETPVRRSAALALARKADLQSIWSTRDGLLVRQRLWRDSNYLTPAADRALEDQIRDAERRARVLARAAVLREERATSGLIKAALEDGDRMVRHFAITALGRLASPDAVSWLAGQLDRTELAEFTRAWVAMALADARAVVALPKLRELALSKSIQASHRNAYLLALGVMRDESSGPSMVKLATEAHDPEVRAGAALGLGMMNFRPAAVQLRDALAREDRVEVRPALGMALATLGDVPTLDMLETQILAGKGTLARMESAGALQSFHVPKAHDVLLKLLADGEGTDQLRAVVIHAIGEVGQKGFVSPLDRAAERWNYLLSWWPITDALLR
jgi:HEAT repeat protein